MSHYIALLKAETKADQDRRDREAQAARAARGRGRPRAVHALGSPARAGFWLLYLSRCSVRACPCRRCRPC